MNTDTETRQIFTESLTYLEDHDLMNVQHALVQQVLKKMPSEPKPPSRESLARQFAALDIDARTFVFDVTMSLIHTPDLSGRGGERG